MEAILEYLYFCKLIDSLTTVICTWSLIFMGCMAFRFLRGEGVLWKRIRRTR